MITLKKVRARFARNEGLPFAEILTEASIRDALNEHDVKYRDRVFSPVTTIWGFLSQVLNDDHSCSDAVSRIIAHRAASGLGTLFAKHGQLLQRPWPRRHRRPAHPGTTNRRGVTGRGRAAVEVERAECIHRRRDTRLHAGHAGESGELPTAADPEGGDWLPLGPGHCAPVAGDRRLS